MAGCVDLPGIEEEVEDDDFEESNKVTILGTRNSTASRKTGNKMNPLPLVPV